MPLLDIHTHNPAAMANGTALVTAGIHPWELTEANAEGALEHLLGLIVEKRISAIGESGLDKLTQAPIWLQTSVFERQVEWSEAYRLPLIIHCVKATDELLDVRKRYRPLQPWILHGFRGKPQQAEQLLRHGLYLSFGERFSEAALRLVPDERLFVETDTSPLGIGEILERVASARGVEAESLRETIRRNIRNVFQRGD
ncbi:MAG: TatD family hydrolase [Mediterranea sp.]|jgi:TatD DNase family protein|nr:TatD family hydrolase [Mediterranea sp.]